MASFAVSYLNLRNIFFSYILSSSSCFLYEDEDSIWRYFWHFKKKSSPCGQIKKTYGDSVFQSCNTLHLIFSSNFPQEKRNIFNFSYLINISRANKQKMKTWTKKMGNCRQKPPILSGIFKKKIIPKYLVSYLISYLILSDIFQFFGKSHLIWRAQKAKVSLSSKIVIISKMRYTPIGRKLPRNAPASRALKGSVSASVAASNHQRRFSKGRLITTLLQEIWDLAA